MSLLLSFGRLLSFYSHGPNICHVCVLLSKTVSAVDVDNTASFNRDGYSFISFSVRAGYFDIPPFPPLFGTFGKWEWGGGWLVVVGCFGADVKWGARSMDSAMVILG